MVVSRSRLFREGGSQHLGKGLTKLIQFIDEKTGASGKPILQRPSFWISLLGGGALIYASTRREVPSPYDEVCAALGWYLTTNIWDHIEQVVSGQASFFGVS